MNLQAYANHRKTLGLRGTSHVAVLNAINDGRLSEPAVQRQGRSWVINPELADEQWASRTDPSERGAMGIYAPRATGPKPAATVTAEPPPAAVKGGPPLAVSKQVKAAYEAKLAELDYKERSGEMVNLQDVRKEAARLARQVRDLLLTHGFPSVAAPGFEAPGVVVSYTTDPEIQSSKKFLALGLQTAAGVPLQCDEPADFRTFRMGLFGLDKWHQVPRTLQHLSDALETIAPKAKLAA